MLLTLLVVTTTTLVHLSHLGQTILEDTWQRAELMTRQMYAASARALVQAPRQDPLDALRRDGEIRVLLDATVGYSPHLLYALISDRSRRTVVHSDPARRGEVVPERPDFRGLLRGDVLRRVQAIFWGEDIYEAALPLDLDGAPFATIRLGIAMSLVRRELQAALGRSAALGGLALLAALGVAIGLSNVTLRPIRQLADDMARLQRGEFEVGGAAGPKDEFGKLAFQLQLLGRQIHQDRVRLRGERTQFQTAVDQLDDGLVLIDAERRVLFLNRAAEATLGSTPTEPSGVAPGAPLAPDHPLGQLVAQAFEHGASVRNVSTLLPGGGPGRECLASVFPVPAPGGRYDGAILLLKDPTSVAVSARTLQSLVRYASQLTALGQLTSGVTHEVKNALNAMTIHAELLGQALAADGSGRARQSLDVLRSEIKRLAAVVERFADETRPPSVTAKDLDLGGILRDVVGLLETEWRPKGVRFALRLDPPLPAVRGDDDLLRSAFLNVILNACQAMPTGGSITVASELEAGAVARVTVADTGAGIPADDLDQVFALYYTTKPQGSGMGLPLVRRVIEAHGGQIEVESEVGRGTTVHIRLPLEGPA